jgi:ubiquinone/menaquinone biosynthesis C-methylase UbiE
MTEDKSLFYYGWLYHKLFDREFAEAREIVVNLVPEKASVLDIACGTGQLSFALREKKNCRVVGIDISLRMLRFAEKSNPNDGVKFVHADATNLADLADDSFDFAIILLLMHEVPEEKQSLVLKEASRVAHKIIIMDAKVPLPKNAHGRAIRFVEATFGRDHNGNFKSFLKNDGINGVLKRSKLPLVVETQLVFWHKCRELIMVARQRL